MNETMKENFRMIFRTAGMLNYHVTRGKAEKGRILKDLLRVRSLSKQILECLTNVISK